MKDAGNAAARTRHQYDSGPLWQPGADEGGGIAAPAALAQPYAARSPDRNCGPAPWAARAPDREWNLRQAHTRVGAARRRHARVCARGGDRSARRFRSMGASSLRSGAELADGGAARSRFVWG